MSEDLTTVIEDSITDAVIGTEPEVSTDLPDPAPVESTPDTAPAVTEPATKDEKVEEPANAVDDFDKKYGLTQNSPTGRENRIPYSRVKKITEKAVKDAQAEWSKTSDPKIQQYEAKVKDYETRLAQVTEFERVMAQEPNRFLEFLSGIPQYKPFFDEIDKAYKHLQSQAAGGAVDPNVQVTDDMPQPDQKLSDGTLTYSMEGLRALNAWNRAQARKETLEEVQKQFGPIRNDWEAQQRIQAAIPKVQKQIEEANKWPQFKENEAEIVKVLQENPNISLEGAYRQVVFPRLVLDKNKIREEVIREIKAQPRATSASASPVKPSPVQSTGPKSLEEIITEAAQTLKR